jgi:folylpolyglutamate synthase/dihydropteroate synthase
VFGMMIDKDVKAAAARLFPLFEHVIVTHADPVRGCDPTVLAGLARRHAVACTIRRRPVAAVREALERGEDTLVCGSLYVAGAAIPLLDRRRTASDTIRGRRRTS